MYVLGQIFKTLDEDGVFILIFPLGHIKYVDPNLVIVYTYLQHGMALNSCNVSVLLRELLEHIEVVPDEPSKKVMELKENKQIKHLAKVSIVNIFNKL